MILTDRAYQSRTYAAAQEAVRAGKRAILVVSPTGSGKTCMGATLAARHVAKGGRVVWWAHRRELIDQAARTLRSFGLDVGANGTNVTAPVQVCSVQTAIARKDVPPATLRIWDEAHHFAADAWAEIPKAYGGVGYDLGLTATPERGDGRALSHFDHLIVSAQTSELIALGHLVPCDVIRPRAPLRTGQIVRSPVDAYLEHASRSSALVFAAHTKDSGRFIEEFVQRGVSCAELLGTTAAHVRDHLVTRFREGKVRVLVSVGVLTEGFDATIAATAILARGVGTPGLYIQIAGRILRPHPGKARATFIDLRGVSHLLGDPTEDRDFCLDGDGIRRRGPADGPRMCRVCGALMPDDGGPCVECGTAGKPLEAAKVVGGELGKFAAMRALPPDKRVAWLAKQVAVMRAKGYKRGWLTFRFRAIFGHHPSAAMIAEAERMVGDG